MEIEQVKLIIESVLFAASSPVSLEKLAAIFSPEDAITKAQLQAYLAQMQEDYQHRSFELKELASGYCFQVRLAYAPFVARLWEEKPQKYSRAVLETLVIIAYRQPVTRAEIENIRGVAVSSSLIKMLLERDWIKVVGHRDVPGKPGIYATTKSFLDYFNLKSLNELPTVDEIKDLDQLSEKISEKISEQFELTMGITAEDHPREIHEFETENTENE